MEGVGVVGSVCVCVCVCVCVGGEGGGNFLSPIFCILHEILFWWPFADID